MRNPEQTKEKILSVASSLFNTQGYKATSLSDITFASGFTKGAIYQHFDNKSELEKEALIYMCNIVSTDLRRRVKEQEGAHEKVKAIFRYYTSYIVNPILPGGCPILNAAVEVDDTMPELRAVASHVMESFHESMVVVLKNGIRFGQLKDTLDVEDFASLIISSFEGAIMMSKLVGTNDHIKRVFGLLEKYLDDYSIISA